MEKHEESMEFRFESFQFIDDDIKRLIPVDPPLETGNSFTALLELPSNQAVQLLHSPKVLFSVFPATETASLVPSHSSPNNSNVVKQEPIETVSALNSSPIESKSTKRNNRDKERLSAKKIKSAGKYKDGEKVEYVHVRARPGEATDSHSLAERARREKINARMKLLQELVPGCSKISGTALVLEKIIKHVQSLQLQVEFLSMKLAAVQPDIDIDLNTLFSSESESPMESNFAGMVSPSWWVDGQEGANSQQMWHPEGLTNFVSVPPEKSLLSYDSSSNSAEPGLKSYCDDRMFI